LTFEEEPAMSPAASPPLPRPDPPPYFDGLFSRLAANEPFTAVAYGRHVHWGWWADPKSADGTPTDYAWAAEQLGRKVCDAAAVRDGQRLLDVGCGFGGTIASLNERFRNLDMTGLNIDARQLARGASEFQALHGNCAAWVEGDAGALPMDDASFDVVLAVECVFHFPSRASFFREAGRVLKPGGTMALSDFVPPAKAVPMLRAFNTSADEATRRTYGHIDVLCSRECYQTLAEEHGLELTRIDNINAGTMPTYSFLKRTIREHWQGSPDVDLYERATAQLEMACRTGLLAYSVLSFRKCD